MRFTRWNLESLLILVTLSAPMALFVANSYQGELILKEYQTDRLLTADDLQSPELLQNQSHQLEHVNAELESTDILVVSKVRNAYHADALLKRWGESCTPAVNVESYAEILEAKQKE